LYLDSLSSIERYIVADNSDVTEKRIDFDGCAVR
jgi:hypothetical protein